jgi:hypothetical protein
MATDGSTKLDVICPHLAGSEPIKFHWRKKGGGWIALQGINSKERSLYEFGIRPNLIPSDRLANSFVTEQGVPRRNHNTYIPVAPTSGRTDKLLTLHTIQSSDDQPVARGSHAASGVILCD